jgi:hypothetical protein
VVVSDHSCRSSTTTISSCCVVEQKTATERPRAASPRSSSIYTTLLSQQGAWCETTSCCCFVVTTAEGRFVLCELIIYLEEAGQLSTSVLTGERDFTHLRAEVDENAESGVRHSGPPLRYSSSHIQTPLVENRRKRFANSVCPRAVSTVA